MAAYLTMIRTSKRHYYFTNRLYSSIFQHERKKEQSVHISALFVSTKYCLPEISATLFSTISIIQGGVCDLQPCLLSQFMQKPFFGFIIRFLLIPSEYNTSFLLKMKRMPRMHREGIAACICACQVKTLLNLLFELII